VEGRGAEEKEREGERKGTASGWVTRHVGNGEKYSVFIGSMFGRRAFSVAEPMVCNSLPDPTRLLSTKSQNFSILILLAYTAY